MSDCIFCKIINDELPSTKVYEDENILAFHDISPQTPVHIIIIPKVHISAASELNEQNSEIVAKIFAVIPKIAKDLGLEHYRIVNNCGPEAGQTVFHLHFHLLGGRVLNGKMA
ncbi:MAG: histidine triad nucleotide-binding protein [Bacillota bacterium]|nr:histidine triad nucleotide-binding protein [Bacillota bacterium]